MLFDKLNNNTFTMQEVLDFFDMTALAFSEHSGIPKKTIEGWKDKGISSLGRVALKNICLVRISEDNFKIKTKELQDKSNDLDKVIEIFLKYSKKV